MGFLGFFVCLFVYLLLLLFCGGFMGFLSNAILHYPREDTWERK